MSTDLYDRLLDAIAKSGRDGLLDGRLNSLFGDEYVSAVGEALSILLEDGLIVRLDRGYALTSDLFARLILRSLDIGIDAERVAMIVAILDGETR